MRLPCFLLPSQPEFSIVPRQYATTHQAVRRGAMARLTPNTSRNQVDAKDHAIVATIMGSRGLLPGPHFSGVAILI